MKEAQIEAELRLLLHEPVMMPPRPEVLQMHVKSVDELAHHHAIHDWERHNPSLLQAVTRARKHLEL